MIYVAGWSWHRADTVCFTCHGSGPIWVNPGESRLEYGFVFGVFWIKVAVIFGNTEIPDTVFHKGGFAGKCILWYFYNKFCENYRVIEKISLDFIKNFPEFEIKIFKKLIFSSIFCLEFFPRIPKKSLLLNDLYFYVFLDCWFMIWYTLIYSGAWVLRKKWL